MARYIDAYKAKNEIRKRKSECDKCDDKFTLGIVEAALDYVETADVEPVRHGHWIYHEHVITGEDDGIIGVYECSVCHAPVPEAVFDFLMEGFYKDYCGACGAKMDEVKK